jgi:hypothetical protein
MTNPFRRGDPGVTDQPGVRPTATRGCNPPTITAIRILSNDSAPNAVVRTTTPRYVANRTAIS